jgi:hypothetical protein
MVIVIVLVCSKRSQRSVDMAGLCIKIHDAAMPKHCGAAQKWRMAEACIDLELCYGTPTSVIAPRLLL